MREPTDISTRLPGRRKRALARDEEGSVSMEYGLVGTLISVAIIASLSSATTGLGDKWNSVANTINSFLR